MKYFLRKFKKTNECDSCCADGMATQAACPPCDFSYGMGPVIPGFSGDRFDNIYNPTKRVKKRKRPLRKRTK